MTPEQRAERLVEQNFGLALWRPGNARTAEREIASAIRAAENAAVEEVAKWIDSLNVEQSRHASATLRKLSRAIREEFKTRAPRATRAK